MNYMYCITGHSGSVAERSECTAVQLQYSTVHVYYSDMMSPDMTIWERCMHACALEVYDH